MAEIHDPELWHAINRLSTLIEGMQGGNGGERMALEGGMEDMVEFGPGMWERARKAVEAGAKTLKKLKKSTGADKKNKIVALINWTDPLDSGLVYTIEKKNGNTLKQKEALKDEISKLLTSIESEISLFKQRYQAYRTAQENAADFKRNHGDKSHGSNDTSEEEEEEA
jgi:hypothetical protein